MKVIIAGDFCPQGRVSPLLEREDYQSVLGGVKELVSFADYAIVNYECPIGTGTERPIIKQGPNLCCSPKGIEAIKWVGFNGVTLANNHFYDFGDGGVKNTLEICREAKIDTVGGGLDIKAASATLYKQICEQTLAIINCCEHEFSIAADNHGGANPLNPVQQYYAIKEAKEKADYVLVIVHGGHEHWPLPSPRMQETYRFFIDAGADAVVNHHQHCYSGYEVYHKKPIFYGLGNFCFDRVGNWGAKWYEGLMIKLTFNNESVGYEYYPYHQCLDAPSVMLLNHNAFDETLGELNAIINDEKRLATETEKYYAKSVDIMSEVFEPCVGRYFIAGKRRGWFPSLITTKRKLLAENFICCESHRDKMIYYLEHE